MIVCSPQSKSTKRIGIPGLKQFLIFCLAAFFLVTSCEDDPDTPTIEQDGSSIIEIEGLQDDPTVLSPPIVVEPLLRCGESVKVKGFVPGARIEIFANTIAIGSGIGLDPEGQTFPVSPELVRGEMVTAIQTFDGLTSLPSVPARVKDITEEYPGGLPDPGFPALHLYDCGVATLVNNLPPGGKVEVSQRPSTSDAFDVIGSRSGVAAEQGLGVSPFIEDQLVSAQSFICDFSSDRSIEYKVLPAPATIPTPIISEIYDEGMRIVLHDIVNGAKITVSRGGTILGGGGAPSSHVNVGLNDVVRDGEVLEVVQELCGVPSPTGTVTVSPCDDLPAPYILAPRAGDEILHLARIVAGARVQIFSSGTQIGDGGGNEVRLIRPLVAGEDIVAVQSQGNCFGSTGHTLAVGSGLDDPSQPGLCSNDFNEFEYGGDGDNLTTDVSSFFNSPDGRVSVSMDEVPLHGVVRYPSGPGPFPIVLIVHGNHNPRDLSYPGYDYLLENWASHCMIAVSVEEDFLNGDVGGEMDARAIVLLRHLQLWREWNRTPGHRFYGKVDMGNIGLAGHSRGGEAIVAANLLNRTLHDRNDAEFDFNFGIRSLFAIAPVDGQFDGGRITHRGADYYIMHGTHDGDVSSFGGHRCYDRAFPVTQRTGKFKGLLWIHGANHGQWNSRWERCCDRNIVPFSALISSSDQKLIGETYMSAFFLAGLKGWTSYKYFLNGEVSFTSLPRSIPMVTRFQDPDKVFLNHYDEDDDEATGSLGTVTNAPSGTFVNYDDIAFTDTDDPHFLWGETDGLIVGWDAGTPEVHIDIEKDEGQFEDFEFVAFHVGQTFESSPTLNAVGVDMDFNVQLEFSGTTGPERPISTYGSLIYPLEISPAFEGIKSVQQTIRIPLADLFGATTVDINEITRIRLKMNARTTGNVAIDEIQFTN